MRVFKFGGASVKDAEAVRHMSAIIADEKDLVVVVSAMNKTTNNLEKVVDLFVQKNDEWKQALKDVFDFHRTELTALVGADHTCFSTLEKIQHYAFTFLEQDTGSEFDFLYDQIVSIGEILSTKIIEAYLLEQKIAARWTDARKLIHTDNAYREAKVNWEESASRIKAMAGEEGPSLILTQGFIGGGDHNRMTTLGREGSDFSAAIFASCLDATSVTIWKDVPGMLNADPKFFRNTTLLENISYREAIELSYYGASVIHPKTVKPLKIKGIPLYVKGFQDPTNSGTLIDNNPSEDHKTPSYIFRGDQVLLTISSRDFSFIVEEHISELFGLFAKHKLKIHTMQNSAISFSVSIDRQPERMKALIKEIEREYQVLYNEGLELLTIRHYNEEIVQELVKDRDVLLEQTTRHTLRILMRVRSDE